MQIERDKISYLVGSRIHDYRVQRKMSQEELALASEIHPAYLGRLERGEKCPSIDTLYKVSQGLKLPLSELLDISADVKPSHNEAMHRIQEALSALTDEEATDIAEIVEKIAAFKRNAT